MKETKLMTTPSSASDTSLCLLHIGKTGGTCLKSILRHNSTKLPESLKILNHSDTLVSTRKELGPKRQLAFIFREPAARFRSGFMSRLRQGRPVYESLWTNEEAIAFNWFATPNSLAEALGSEDDRLRSAALFAMRHIRHIKLSYKYFLGGVDRLQKEGDNLRIMIDLPALNERLPEIMTALGVPDFEMPPRPESHKTNSGPVDDSLSEAGLAALKQYWATEFEIYEYCKNNQRIL